MPSAPLAASRTVLGKSSVKSASPKTMSELSVLSGLMKGKRGLIMGVANERSIAAGIASACANAGASLALSYQEGPLQERVRAFGEQFPAVEHVLPCNVTEPESIEALFAELSKQWGGIDFLVHAISFSDKNQLNGRYVDTTLDNFLLSMQVSCFSFTQVCKHAAALMPNGGSMLTLTYYGAQKVMPHYNVMGVAKAALEASVRYIAVDLGPDNIRVNAVSAGPIKTLAASGIRDFRYILKWNQHNSPLRRTVTIGEVGNAALYLLSDMGQAVTGEVHYVDAGYHVVGMKAEDAPDISTV